MLVFFFLILLLGSTSRKCIVSNMSYFVFQGDVVVLPHRF